MPLDLKGVQKLTPDFVQRLLAKFSSMSLEEVEKHIARDNATILDVMVGKCMVKAAKEGDHQRFGFLLDRMIGKLKAEVTHNIEPETHVEKQPAQIPEQTATVYVVEVNDNGKFLRPRPREISPTIIDAEVVEPRKGTG